MVRFQQILGIRFFTGDMEGALKLGCAGGLVVAPAAPALVELSQDLAYRQALLNSDLVLTDSGLMIWLWLVLRQERIPRISGLRYLKGLLASPCPRKPGSFFWVMASTAAQHKAVEWLRQKGIPVTPDDCYVAPFYEKGNIHDAQLVTILEKRHPDHVVLCLGGGVQETLGHYLKRHLSYLPGLHCTGAALGFLSGEQANIPAWADRLFIGWLLRCFHQPKRFIPRYLKALRLVFIMIRYGEKMPEAIGSQGVR